MATREELVKKLETLKKQFEADPKNKGTHGTPEIAALERELANRENGEDSAAAAYRPVNDKKLADVNRAHDVEFNGVKCPNCSATFKQEMQLASHLELGHGLKATAALREAERAFQAAKGQDAEYGETPKQRAACQQLEAKGYKYTGKTWPSSAGALAGAKEYKHPDEKGSVLVTTEGQVVEGR